MLVLFYLGFFFLSFDLGVSLIFAGDAAGLLGGSSERRTSCVCDVSSMPEGLEGEEHLDFPLKGFLKKYSVVTTKNFCRWVLDFAETGRRKSAGEQEEKRL